MEWSNLDFQNVLDIYEYLLHCIITAIANLARNYKVINGDSRIRFEAKECGLGNKRVV